METKTIQLAKQLLIQNGAQIHPASQELMIWAYIDKGRERTSFVCSLLGSNLTVSISINGKANLKSSWKLVKQIFGKHFSIDHLSDNDLDGLQANYFSLAVLNG